MGMDPGSVWVQIQYGYRSRWKDDRLREHIQIIACDNEIDHILFGVCPPKKNRAVNECPISAVIPTLPARWIQYIGLPLSDEGGHTSPVYRVAAGNGLCHLIGAQYKRLRPHPRRARLR
jgi:hypothetical protein